MAALTADDLKQLISAMTQVCATSISEAMSQVIQETKRVPHVKGHIDHRAIGGPPDWDSTNEAYFLEWQIKIPRRKFDRKCKLSK